MLCYLLSKKNVYQAIVMLFTYYFFRTTKWQFFNIYSAVFFLNLFFLRIGPDQILG